MSGDYIVLPKLFGGGGGEGQYESTLTTREFVSSLVY